jgi:hypothetical protein
MFDAVLRRARTAIVIAFVAGGCFSVPAVATAQTDDSATGSGTTTWSHCQSDSTVIFNFSAMSGASGENPSGSFSFACPINSAAWSGTVSCLNVTGNTATLGGTITQSNTGLFPVGQALHFSVSDTPDALSDLTLGAVCTSFDSPNHAVATGDIVVQDAAPPPPVQCADGIDNDSDGKVDLADPGCSSATDDSESPDPPPSAPTSKQQCMHDGWQNYPQLGFRNQGDCIRYVK